MYSMLAMGQVCHYGAHTPPLGSTLSITHARPLMIPLFKAHARTRRRFRIGALKDGTRAVRLNGLVRFRRSRI